MMMSGRCFTVIVPWALIALVVAGCGNTNTLDPGNTIISVWDLHFRKSNYYRGETFDTAGDRLWVGYADGRWGYINSGFTHEWAKESGGPWVTIRHGDPLPINTPYGYYFYVRADYYGLKGIPDQRYGNL